MKKLTHIPVLSSLCAYSLLMLVLSVSLTACAQEHSHDEHSHAHGETASGESHQESAKKESSTGMQASMDRVIQQYLVLHDKLAGDQTEGVKTIGSKLMNLSSHLNTLAKTEGKGDLSWWSPQLKEFQKRAEKLANFQGSDLKEARTAFSGVSSFVFAYLSKFKGVDEKHGYHAFSCPMVKDDFNRWLQKDAEIRNPFFGKAMATCGTKIDLNK